MRGGSWAAIGVGALLLFVGVIVAGPFLAHRAARGSRGRVLSRFGLEGRLAVDNTARNPQRTATTANALLIGVFLVTLVTAAGTSVKDFAVDEIKKLDSADYIVTSDGGTIDAAAAGRASRRIDGVNTVTPFRRASVTIDGRRQPALQPATSRDGEGRRPQVRRAARPRRSRRPARSPCLDADGHPELGATVKVADNDGQVRASSRWPRCSSRRSTAQVGALIAELDVRRAGRRDRADGRVRRRRTRALRPTPRTRSSARADTRPDITVDAGNALGKIVGSVFDFVINAVNGLLGMSVIVALIGIVNTLSLSILERRRELGLLRVVGMVDKRVQRMVRLESVVIAALGTLTGVAARPVRGLGARLLDRPPRRGRHRASASRRLQLAIVLVARRSALGLLASIIPARRSTRLDVLEAIQAT